METDRCIQARHRSHLLGIEARLGVGVLLMTLHHSKRGPRILRPTPSIDVIPKAREDATSIAFVSSPCGALRLRGQIELTHDD